jgi:hypothetical protein
MVLMWSSSCWSVQSEMGSLASANCANLQMFSLTALKNRLLPSYVLLLILKSLKKKFVLIAINLVFFTYNCSHGSTNSKIHATNNQFFSLDFTYSSNEQRLLVLFLIHYIFQTICIYFLITQNAKDP